MSTPDLGYLLRAAQARAAAPGTSPVADADAAAAAAAAAALGNAGAAAAGPAEHPADGVFAAFPSDTAAASPAGTGPVVGPRTPALLPSQDADTNAERRQADRPTGAMAGLIAELRSYQAELETQNKVLRYSQAAAESASERFEALFSSVPLALMVLDEHDLVVQANAMAHRSFQPGERDRALTHLMPFVDAGHATRVQHAFALARSAGQAVATEVVFRIGAQAQVTGDLHIARIEAPQHEGPALLQFLCAVIDQGPLLTERRALQHSSWALQERNAQLHASERRLEAIINSALDAIVCVDQHQRITVFNPTTAALFQCAARDALGSPVTRFLPDAEHALAFAQLATQALLGEMTALSASGKELAVEVSVSFERHADGETTTLFVRDLTGRKKAEAHRSELEAQLRESHKMQAVGTMAGGIAHDFNNILASILGNAELAKADLSADMPALESLLEIEKAGRRARDLVRQILTFSRNEAPRRVAVQLPEVLNETCRLLRVTLPPAVTLHMHLGNAALPTLLADPTQVEQALLNLCTNAIQALGPQGGRIDIEAALVLPDKRLSERLNLLPGQPHVALCVRDTGPGMDADTVQRVFEPFFTTKPVGQGTGLGLAVVHGVMRTHQGGIDVRSTPGQGSQFTLYFPALAQEAVQQLQQPPQALPAPEKQPAQPAQQPPAQAQGPAPDKEKDRRPGAGAAHSEAPAPAPAPVPAPVPETAAPTAQTAVPATASAPAFAPMSAPDTAPSAAASGTPAVGGLPATAAAPAAVSTAVSASAFASAAAAPVAAATSPGAPRHHVMYVDDDEALVFLVQRLLRRRGYEVSGFTDPHAAAAALRAAPHRYDLLVTDYNMPGYCGVDLVREARSIRADLPVALASGYITADIEREALAEGARALIHKPNDAAELCATVQRLVGDSPAGAGA